MQKVAKRYKNNGTWMRTTIKESYVNWIAIAIYVWNKYAYNMVKKSMYCPNICKKENNILICFS